MSENSVDGVFWYFQVTNLHLDTENARVVESCI